MLLRLTCPVCFRVYDEDGNGYITRDELARVLALITRPQGGDVDRCACVGACAQVCVCVCVRTMVEHAVPGPAREYVCVRVCLLCSHLLRLESAFEAMDTNLDGRVSLTEFKVRRRCC